jgi:hypothetical protein
VLTLTDCDFDFDFDLTDDEPANRDVCMKDSDSGIDLITPLSSLITKDVNPTCVALGLESLTALCQDDAVDFKTAWGVIGQTLDDVASPPPFSFRSFSFSFSFSLLLSLAFAFCLRDVSPLPPLQPVQENRPLVLAYIAKFFACGAPELNPDDDEVCAHVLFRVPCVCVCRVSYACACACVVWFVDTSF